MDKQLWLNKAKELMRIQSQLKDLEAVAAMLKEDLKILSLNESHSFSGFSYIKTERKGVIDYSKIPELKLVDLELYRREPTYSWTLKMYLEK